MNEQQRLVFIDLETAGGEPHHPIIQIAAIAVDHEQRQRDVFEMKIAFRESDACPQSLARFESRRCQWKRCAVPERQAALTLARFLRRNAFLNKISANRRPFRVAQLVAHNGPYDGEFLQQWFARLDVFLPASFRTLCTMQRAIWYFRENPLEPEPVDFKLPTLCRHFGITLKRNGRHDALNDVRATVELYRWLALNDHRATTLACGQLTTARVGVVA